MSRINDESGRFTLASAPTGMRLTVLRVVTAPSMSKRLGALGLRSGAPVEVLHEVSGGGRTIAVSGARLVLDRSLLQAINVDEVNR